MTDDQSFPDLLKMFRKTKGWTQEEMAKEWGYSAEAISAWEREVRTPNSQQIPRIAALLDIEAEKLVRMLPIVHGREHVHTDGHPSKKRGRIHTDEEKQNSKGSLEIPGDMEFIFANRTDFNREISYPRLFDSAKSILAVGISLNAIAMNYSTENILKLVTEKNTSISLCFLDPECEHCAAREREEGIPEKYLHGLTDLNIRNMQDVQRRITKNYPNYSQKFQILVYSLPARYNIYIVDDTLMTVQTYAHVRGEDTPTFVLKRKSDNGLFQFYASVAQHVLEHSRAIGE